MFPLHARVYISFTRTLQEQQRLQNSEPSSFWQTTVTIWPDWLRILKPLCVEFLNYFGMAYIFVCREICLQIGVFSVLIDTVSFQVMNVLQQCNPVNRKWLYDFLLHRKFDLYLQFIVPNLNRSSTVCIMKWLNCENNLCHCHIIQSMMEEWDVYINVSTISAFLFKVTYFAK